MDDLVSAREAARELGVTARRVYQLLGELGMEPAMPGVKGRGRGARLSREQVDRIRARRVERLEAELRDARGEG